MECKRKGLRKNKHARVPQTTYDGVKIECKVN